MRMGLTLEPKERVELAEAASKEKRVRNWRRMRAIELLAEGRSPEAVAEALGCARSSVYAWASQGVARDRALGTSRGTAFWQEAFAGRASRVAFGRTLRRG